MEEEHRMEIFKQNVKHCSLECYLASFSYGLLERTDFGVEAKSSAGVRIPYRDPLNIYIYRTIRIVQVLRTNDRCR
jgi:hypothetical protein